VAVIRADRQQEAQLWLGRVLINQNGSRCPLSHKGDGDVARKSCGPYISMTCHRHPRVRMGAHSSREGAHINTNNDRGCCGLEHDYWGFGCARFSMQGS
jgi:hypothetical protein